MYQVFIITLLVIIIPSLGLTFFLINKVQNEQLHNYKENLIYGQNILNTLIESETSRIQSVCIKIADNPSFREYINTLEQYTARQKLNAPIPPPNKPHTESVLKLMLKYDISSLFYHSTTHSDGSPLIKIFSPKGTDLNTKQLERFLKMEKPASYNSMQHFSTNGVEFYGIFPYKEVNTIKGFIIVGSEIISDSFDSLHASLNQDFSILAPTQNSGLYKLLLTTYIDDYGSSLSGTQIGIPSLSNGLPEHINAQSLRTVQFENSKHTEMGLFFRFAATDGTPRYGLISASREAPASEYYYIILITVFFLIIVSIASYLAARRIVLPIRELSRAVKNLPSGITLEHSVQFVKVHRNDEIGDLARGFNTMSEELQKNFGKIHKQKEQIKKYTDQLEDMVQDRTKKLEQAKQQAEIANYHKTKFLAHMNHELRNPLNSIKAVVDLLRYGAYEQEDAVADKLEAIYQGIADKQNENSNFPQNNFSNKRMQQLHQTVKNTAQQLKNGGDIEEAFANLAEGITDAVSELSEKERTELVDDLKKLLRKKRKETAKAYEMIRDAGDLLINIINTILEISRIEAGKTEVEIQEVNIEEVLHSTLVLIKNYAHAKNKKNLDLSMNLAESVPVTIKADEQKLRQVLLNYGTNAVKYTNTGSVVFKVTMSDGMVHFAITDTGIGISEKQKDLLFMEFSRAEEVRHIEGIGLGLAYSKKLIELHGGNVGLTSEYGKGSTFWFELPVESEPVHYDTESV